MTRVALTLALLFIFLQGSAIWAQQLDLDAQQAPNDVEQMVASLKQAAADGEPEAQYSLGVLYQLGEGGLEQDLARAKSLYESAVQADHPGAMNNLGHMYRVGQGVEQDLGEALELFRAAAGQDHPLAHYNLGLMFEQGQGVERDVGEAMSRYNTAASRGHLDAGYRLGILLARQGELQAAEQALFQVAAQGHVDAQTDLAILFVQPRPDDTPEETTNRSVAAFVWVNLAAERGDERAREVRKEFREQIGNRELLAIAQQQLTDLGYDTKGVDGLIGRNTRSAIQAFSEDLGLSDVPSYPEDIEYLIALTAHQGLVRMNQARREAVRQRQQQQGQGETDLPESLAPSGQ